MKKATRERKATNKVYDGDASDLSGAIEAIRNALQVLKASKKPSLVQLQSVSESVRQIVRLADALGFGDASVQQTTAIFLQDDPDVPMEDYKFHGNNVIHMLEQLQDGFRKTRSEIEKSEVSSVADYDALMQAKGDNVKAKSVAVDRTRQEKANTISKIALTSEELTSTAAVLLDDKQYLAELAQICSNKAKTWDQRSGVRADELSALTSAVAIIKDTVAEKTSAATVRLAQKSISVRMAQAMAGNDFALEAAEAEAEEVEAQFSGAKVVSFLQRGAKHRNPSALTREEGRQAIIKMLDKQGKHMKSSLLISLAGQIASDPLAKVKQLIGELIERLLHEAASESEQKAFCDKSQAEAKGKRARAAERIEALNGRLAENEAIRDKLAEEIEALNGQITDLKAKKVEAKTMREEEKAENEATVKEATEGLEAVKEAIDIIDKFYKVHAKEDVDLSMVQKGPLDDMPDAGFDAGESYKGAQGKSSGVLGMLDVIKSDFKRTISETKKAENQAEADYLDFLTETEKSLAAKTVAVSEKTKQIDSTLQELEADGDALESQVEMLQNAIKELLDLKPVCVDTGMSYEERVSRREDEIEALKKALCIFTNYAEYGVESAAQC